MKTRHLLPLAALVLATSVQAAPTAPAAIAASAALAGPCADHHHRHHARHDGPRPGGFIERLDERADLRLSDTQKQKLKALGEEERKRHEDIRREYQERLDKVLTAEQRSKLDAHRDAQRDQRADRLEQRAEKLKERAGEIRDGKPFAR